MNFEEYLKSVTPKIGPKNAFDLARDSRLKVLEGMLIKKCGIKQEDIDNAMSEELERLAENINKMPPPPG